VSRPALFFAAWVTVMLSATVTVTVTQPAAAQVEVVTFATAAQESLYRDLLDELRCLVCANQSLADSNAELAGDLRARVFEMVAAGESRAAIVDYLRARYGDYVLYRPRLAPATWFLWFAPVVVVAAGVAFVFVLSRRRGRQDEPLTAAQAERARRLLGGDGGDS